MFKITFKNLYLLSVACEWRYYMTCDNRWIKEMIEHSNYLYYLKYWAITWGIYIRVKFNTDNELHDNTVYQHLEKIIYLICRPK